MCNMSLATCNEFFPTLQDKLQEKFLCVTLAVEFGFACCNDCRDFLKPLQVVAQDSNVSHVSCNLQWIFSSVARQIARKIASCNTSLRHIALKVLCL